MKISSVVVPVSVALLAGTSAPAVAQSALGTFEGAELSYRFTKTSEDYGYNQFMSGVGINFGNLTTQFDLGTGGYDGEFGDPSTWTLHVGYMVSPNTEVGAFYGQETWGGGTSDPYQYYGLEGMYATGAFEVEAALGTYLDNNSSDIYYQFLTVDGAYAFNQNWSALGHLTLTSNSEYYEDFVIIGAGARYETGTGMYAQASYHSMRGEFDNNILEFKVGYEFGNGVTYSNRGWNDVLVTY
ncbi:hypothetical protein [Salibaculum griseiflavum]|uniref:hypothetical protein n=1 Tax=Salibaculum griseiflavum TaxID=1914409 RepID=UPI000D698E7B|nr:hypothetical protein [Salibaculum griseiflavum]